MIGACSWVEKKGALPDLTVTVVEWSFWYSDSSATTQTQTQTRDPFLSITTTTVTDTMARNQEKAQSMLYRFREAQAAELGLGSSRTERRPRLASSVSSLKECEKWRAEVIREISRKVSKIQDCKCACPYSPVADTFGLHR